MSRLLVIAFCLVLSSTARADGYLTDQTELDAAWAKISQTLGDQAALSEVVIEEYEIRLSVRSAASPNATDSYAATPALLGFGVSLRGPRPDPYSAPFRPAFYPIGDVPAPSLVDLFAEALASVVLETPGTVTVARLGRSPDIIGGGEAGEPRWSIRVANERESAEVEATIDGRIIGADISNTARGRDRDFLNQTDWSFDQAALGLSNLAGPGETVYEVEVEAKDISVEAEEPGNPDMLVTYRWDGGRFTSGLMSSPNVPRMTGSGNLPFRYAEARVAEFPAVLAAARAAVPGVPIQRAQAVKEKAVVGAPEVLWIVRLAARQRRIGEMNYEETIVRIRPDASLVSVTLPAGQRQPDDFLDPAQMQTALEALRTVSNDGPVYELAFRKERATVRMPKANDPATIAAVDYVGEGLREGFDFPVMMETEADLFPYSIFVRIEAEAVERMKAQAIAEVGIAGAEVFQIRIWSGQPFWRTKSGSPVIAVYAGVPPRHDSAGYAVFFLDGRLIETVK